MTTYIFYFYLQQTVRIEYRRIDTLLDYIFIIGFLMVIVIIALVLLTLARGIFQDRK